MLWQCLLFHLISSQARNIIIAADLTAKIGDFGLAVQADAQGQFLIPKDSKDILPVRW